MLRVSIYGSLKHPAQGPAPSYSHLEYRGSKGRFKGGCGTGATLVKQGAPGGAAALGKAVLGSRMRQFLVALGVVSD